MNGPYPLPRRAPRRWRLGEVETISGARHFQPVPLRDVHRDDGTGTRSHIPTTEAPCKRELRSFVEAIRKGKPTQTPFTDAAKDVELIAELVSRGTAATDGYQ